MTEDRAAMASEIQRLRKARDRWMVVAGVALAFTFIVLALLSFLLYFWNKQYWTVVIENKGLQKHNETLKMQLQRLLDERK